MLPFRFSSKQLYTTYLRHQKEPSEIMKHSKARGEPNIKDQIKNKIKKRNLTDSVPGSRTLRYREICASTWEAEMLPIHQYGHLLCENGLYLFIWGIKCRLLSPPYHTSGDMPHIYPTPESSHLYWTVLVASFADTSRGQSCWMYYFWPLLLPQKVSVY